MTSFVDLRQIATSANPPRSVTPLFWLHGEDEAILRSEIARMDEGGMAGFVIESRIHPDYLGPSWWRDLALIMDEAASRNMQVWLFDDKHFPSGYAAGVIAREKPQLTRRLILERHLNWIGPTRKARFEVKSWLKEGEQLVSAVALPAISPNRFDGSRSIDLTDLIENSEFRWSVPEGKWTIFFMVETQVGGEEATDGYIDPLSVEAVTAYLQVVYESTYKHLGSYFGTTFRGFFTDEPRFGNVASYTSLLGQVGVPLPYTTGLFADWQSQYDYNPRNALPALWYDCGEFTNTIRYDFMDIISSRFAKVFLGGIQGWCNEHHVKLIGHLVEDNGAHARLGYGTGHFFRSMKHLDMGGCDIVASQVRPEIDEGILMASWGELDVPFFRWELVKLATSSSHHQPHQQGLTMCEAFGAYGWSEGLRLMKWLTDWLCVQGVNRIVPHAFSPAPFPDPDCPPHFWAQGHNPQWPFFRQWADYTNRMCGLLSDGTHVADVLVLYPAESEWVGKTTGLTKIVEALAKAQFDCDILSYEDFADQSTTNITQDGISCNKEIYRAIVLPEVERVPLYVLQRLLECAKLDIPIIYVGTLPKLACSDEETPHVIQLSEQLTTRGLKVESYSDLGKTLREAGLGTVISEKYSPELRHYHYRHASLELYLFFNQDLNITVDTVISVQASGYAELWDIMNTTVQFLSTTAANGSFTFQLLLEPYQTLLLAFNPEQTSASSLSEGKKLAPKHVTQLEFNSNWLFSTATIETYPNFQLVPNFHQLGDWTEISGLEHFAGIGSYTTTFVIEEKWCERTLILNLGEVYELARVRVDGIEVASFICPPYQTQLRKVGAGEHLLEIEITNTLGSALYDDFSRNIPIYPSGLLGPVQLIVLGD